MRLLRNYGLLFILGGLIGVAVFAANPVPVVADPLDPEPICDCIPVPDCVCPAPLEANCATGWCALTWDEYNDHPVSGPCTRWCWTFYYCVEECDP